MMMNFARPWVDMSGSTSSSSSSAPLGLAPLQVSFSDRPQVGFQLSIVPYFSGYPKTG